MENEREREGITPPIKSEQVVFMIETRKHFQLHGSKGMYFITSKNVEKNVCSQSNTHLEQKILEGESK